MPRDHRGPFNLIDQHSIATSICSGVNFIPPIVSENVGVEPDRLEIQMLAHLSESHLIRDSRHNMKDSPPVTIIAIPLSQTGI
jgi:hypothetical protein